MPKEAVGTLVREWRDRRHRSQLDLAHRDRRVSATSELRRDGPRQTESRAGDRARRRAGCPAEGTQHDAPRGRVRAALRRDVALRSGDGDDALRDPAAPRRARSVSGARHRPPLERGAEQHRRDDAGRRVCPPDLLGPPINVYRVLPPPAGSGRAHPELPRVGELPPAPAASICGAHERSNPRRAAGRGDRLSERRRAEPHERGAAWDEPPLLVPVVLELGGAVLSLFTTLTTFGTPRDITLDELAVELFFPADAETEAVLQVARRGGHRPSHAAGRRTQVTRAQARTRRARRTAVMRASRPAAAARLAMISENSPRASTVREMRAAASGAFADESSGHDCPRPCSARTTGHRDRDQPGDVRRVAGVEAQAEREEEHRGKCIAAAGARAARRGSRRPSRR